MDYIMVLFIKPFPCVYFLETNALRPMQLILLQMQSSSFLSTLAVVMVQQLLLKTT